MPVVEMTPHLYRFFPQLEHRTPEVPAGSVAEVPGLSMPLPQAFAPICSMITVPCVAT